MAREDTILTLFMVQPTSIIMQLQPKTLKLWAPNPRLFAHRLLLPTRFELDLLSLQPPLVPPPQAAHRAHSQRSQRSCGLRRSSQESGLPLRKSPCSAPKPRWWLLPLPVPITRIWPIIFFKTSPSSGSITRQSMFTLTSIQESLSSTASAEQHLILSDESDDWSQEHEVISTPQTDWGACLLGQLPVPFLWVDCSADDSCMKRRHWLLYSHVTVAQMQRWGRFSPRLFQMDAAESWLLYILTTIGMCRGRAVGLPCCSVRLFTTQG